MTDPATFAAGLLARGIELTLRGTRLAVWPAPAYASLSDAEREFLRQHRTELKVLARAGLTTLADTSAECKALALERLRELAPRAAAPPPAEPPCVYCGRVCVGAEHPAYRVLHFLDPDEIARRDRDATVVMGAMLRRGSYV